MAKQSGSTESSARTKARTQTAARPTGRRRDHSRDAQILKAAIDTLAEVGYERMTMDMIAVRAKAGKATVYRRWSSKPEMVIEAVTLMKQDEAGLSSLPDTGSLRGDLLGLFKLQSRADEQRKLKAMAGLASMLSQHPEMAEAAHSAIVGPWVAANRRLIERARDRKEIPLNVDIELASQIVPSMAAYRVLLQRKTFNREFLVSLIDGILLPALHAKGS